MPASPACGEALGDLPDADRYPELLDDDATETGAFGKPSAYASEMRCLSNSAWHFGYVRNWDRAVLTSSVRASLLTGIVILAVLRTFYSVLAPPTNRINIR